MAGLSFKVMTTAFLIFGGLHTNKTSFTDLKINFGRCRILLESYAPDV